MRQKFDRNRPDAAELRAKIVHGAFLTEGTMVAFPLCFPAVSVVPAPDESHVTTIAVAPDGTVYAGTSGRAAHLMVGMFHGVTGMVFDMGVPDGATETAAMCCGESSFVAAVNGPAGGRLVTRQLQAPPFDLIQEWHIYRSPLTYVELPKRGQPVLHAVTTADRSAVVGSTETSLFRYDFHAAAVRALDTAGDLVTRGRLALADNGSILGADGPDALFAYDPAADRLERRAIPLPAGNWGPAGPAGAARAGGRAEGAPATHGATDLVWGRDPVTGVLYTADQNGRLYSFTGTTGFDGPLAEVPLSPVRTIGVTPDGRVFASAGEGISRLYRYSPAHQELADIGVAVSTLERRRYGYSFADVATGRDGELVFAEDDNLGHIWLYFPKITSDRRS